MVKEISSFNAVSLFSGCGGLDEGFKKNGFKMLVASELEEEIADIYRKNNPGTEIVTGDIRAVKKEFLEKCCGRRIDALIGGFPCQSFSMSGYRDPSDGRGFLYKEFVDIARKIEPSILIGENVKGLLSFKTIKRDLKEKEMLDFSRISRDAGRLKFLKKKERNGSLDGSERKEMLDLISTGEKNRKKMEGFLESIIPVIIDSFSEIGYRMKYRVLNSADFGVPQSRERIFFIGAKHQIDAFSFPSPTHSPSTNFSSLDDFSTLKKHVSSREAIGDLENAPENGNISHVFTRHGERFLEKIKKTGPGESVFTFSESFRRLFPDLPAPTIKENHNGLPIHYKLDRVITPREMARLQSFDDSFLFSGSKSVVIRAIGNAVPPLLSSAIASKARKFLEKNR